MFRMRLFSISLLAVLVFMLAAPQSGLAAGGVGTPRQSWYPGPGTIVTTLIFSYSPGDPDIYQPVTFNGYIHLEVYPSGNNGSYPFNGMWDFGDGTTIQGKDSPVYHQYSQDGDYIVKILQYTSAGGPPILEAQRTISVRTHDVTVTHMKIHKNMHTGQSRRIEAEVVSNRYDEMVEVHLYKSLAGGAWLPVAAQTQPVPLGLKKPVTYTFDYVVPAEDAQAGKVTFKAEAVISGLRDALPADNTLLSEPVDVKK